MRFSSWRRCIDLIFPKLIVEALGVPGTDTNFYPSILGAVLLGIGIALVIEWRRKRSGLVGLGLGGAIAINLCGGIALAGGLLFGNAKDEIDCRRSVLDRQTAEDKQDSTLAEFCCL